MKTITRDAIVKCQANGNMAQPFVGRVEKVYENSVLVRILEYATADAMNARELLYLTVINKRRLKILQAGVPLKVDESAADVG